MQTVGAGGGGGCLALGIHQVTISEERYAIQEEKLIIEGIGFRGSIIGASNSGDRRGMVGAQLALVGWMGGWVCSP